MVNFPNCKINLGLKVISRREDGYHNLETIFYPLPFYDALEIIQKNKEPSELICYGINVGETEDNLCFKAYALIKRDYSLPPIEMHLLKSIPMGAGLGGGSSDAAFTLMLLNKKFALQIPQERLFEYAFQLGSDCPFFLLNKPALATGRGEILKELDLSLKGYFLKLVFPGIHISTSDIFKHVKPSSNSESLQSVVNSPISFWKNRFKNAFEEIVFQMYPEIEEIKDQLYKDGALYTSMTGTGSTVFGIFEERPPVSKDTHNERWLTL